MVGMEVVGPHALQMLVLGLLLLSNGEVSHGVGLRQRPIVLDSPLLASQLDKEILLGSEESLSKEDVSCGELPLLCILVLYDEIDTVFRCIVQ